MGVDNSVICSSVLRTLGTRDSRAPRTLNPIPTSRKARNHPVEGTTMIKEMRTRVENR